MPTNSEYQKQVTTIQEVFAKFDYDGSGKVKLVDIPQLLLSLGRDEEKAAEVIELLRQKFSDEEATFEQVVRMLKCLECPDGEDSGTGDQKPSPQEPIEEDEEMTTPLSLMKRLREYRRHCEEIGDYAEARCARAKYEDIRAKEEERQRRLVQQAQTHELTEVENAQKQQFLEFSAAWDRYMADYESIAFLGLKRLREQHSREFVQFQESLESNSLSKKTVKFSRKLLEMRRKQHVVAKLGLYEEAYQIKSKADAIEKTEMVSNVSQLSSSYGRQIQRLRAQQQKVVAALLRRIQRDRGEQIRHRQMDSRRLIQRNKNLKTDLIKKQHLEQQRTEKAIGSILSQPEVAQKLLEENPVVLAKTAALGELPTLKAKYNKQLGALPNNYTPPGGISQGRPAQLKNDILINAVGAIEMKTK